ncbi:uncharacterized protein LOC131625551 [Vicia villosa]|uniref:uncharacterized protein LOC131625551 n=1 Tax=Vicia villosa TaxID=3911 RepID=UPI00273AF6C7|nr:uncharacterized protein LOC131625551 [Vicia villosa]
MGLSQSTDNAKCVEKMELVEASGKGSCSAAKGSTKEVEVDDVQRLLLMVLKMADNHLEMDLSHCNSAIHFYMSAKCIRELLMGFHCLDVSTLQVWSTYIHRLCIDNSTSEVYGIMDPAMCIYNDDVPKSLVDVRKYVQEKLMSQNKVCYLLPLVHAEHWQLFVLCPRENTVVFFCSLNWDVDKNTKKIISTAFEVHQISNGNRKKAIT